MGATSAASVYSRWGARSGAHLNPALTLAYAWLRKVGPWDTAFYIASQFAGGHSDSPWPLRSRVNR